MLNSLQRVVSHKHCPLVASAAAVGTIGLMVKNYDSKPKPAPQLSVMTFNVLARPYTKYNRDFHRAETKTESETQTRTRYTLAAEEIASQGTDLVFLQEVEAPFFESAWNHAASKLLDKYSVFACRKMELNNGMEEESPGTAVLVKKSGAVTTSVNSPLCIGGTKDTGGPSKVATVVHAQHGDKPLVAVSTHFTWDGAAAQRQHHAQLIGKSLPEGNVILGGDFNSQPSESLSKLEAASFLGSMTRAALPEGSATGLSGNFSKTQYIDHIYYTSNDLSLLSVKALRAPASPWSGKVTSPAKVSGASDHVPVVAEFEWR